MDAGVATAQRVHGWFPNEDADEDDFELPLWIDNDGWLRLGMAKRDPQHGGDMDQVALKLSDVLVAIGKLLDS
jgi:hypothetical protein